MNRKLIIFLISINIFCVPAICFDIILSAHEMYHDLGKFFHEFKKNDLYENNNK